MTRLIVSALLVAFAVNAYGQLDNQKMLYLKKIERFRKMRNLGFAMAAAGAGCAVYGAVRMSKATYYTNSSGQTTTNDPSAEVIFLLGAPLFGAGLPIGIIGAAKHKQYEKKLMNTRVGLQFTPYSKGLTLTYKFP